MGDGHFTEDQFLIPVRKRKGQRMPEWAEYFNTVLAHYRARIEHVNAIFDRHAIFQTDYRGSYEFLDAIMHVNAHCTNIVLSRNPRYPPCGPWWHEEGDL